MITCKYGYSFLRLFKSYMFNIILDGYGLLHSRHFLLQYCCLKTLRLSDKLFSLKKIFDKTSVFLQVLSECFVSESVFHNLLWLLKCLTSIIGVKVMKKRSTALFLLVVLAVTFFAFSSSGCSCNNVFGEENDVNKYLNKIKSIEDIDNLVTDDDRLVINYFDAYLWAVYFSEGGSIEHMTYIYDFKTPEDAESNVKTRKEELERNKTMTIKSARAVDKYIVVDLVDTSFTNVSRNMLEYNFSMLIVY